MFLILMWVIESWYPKSIYILDSNHYIMRYGMQILKLDEKGILPIIHYPKGSIIVSIGDHGKSLIFKLEKFQTWYVFRFYISNSCPGSMTMHANTSVQKACESFLRGNHPGKLYQFSDQLSLEQFLVEA